MNNIIRKGSDLVENINSKEAYELLREDKNSVLIDVRTKKEHLAIGIPDLGEIGKETCLIEWKNSILPWSRKSFLNDFYENLALDQEGKYIFICRSGIRSNFAALTIEESFISGNYKSKCFNVADGFEGHEQPLGDSQNQTGWKNLGLPWK